MLLGSLVLTGCQTARFYSQAIEGQLALLRGRKPITSVLADPTAPDTVRRKLELALELRQFAARELDLPVDDHYLTYVDLGRPYAVWNVRAAPEFSIESKGWWYPFAGRLTYRGYFEEADAHQYGRKLSRRGYDVYVEAVETYSTLGWFKDPILNTLMHHGEITFAEILFHELAHQKLFISGDTDFNEAFATAVAEAGVKRWLRTTGNLEGIERYEKALRRQRQFVDLILSTREKLNALYASATQSGRKGRAADPMDAREKKHRILVEMRGAYEQLKIQWNGYAGYDAWFDRPVNNAQLNSVATYYDLVPGFHAMLTTHGEDLKRFYHTVEALRSMPKPERHLKVREARRKSPVGSLGVP